jgi:CheY-like chemotaxis protein
MICDLIMPKMDGFTFLEKLRDKNIETPVLVLTNLGQKEDEDRVRQFNPAKFFVKSDTPINEVANYVIKTLKNG